MSKKTYRYYSIFRPVSIGTAPKEGQISFHNFDQREYVESIGREAWGYVEYDAPLTKKQPFQYDLVLEGTEKKITIIDIEENEDLSRDVEHPGYTITFDDGSTYSGVTCACGEGCDGTDDISYFKIGDEFNSFEDFKSYIEGE